MIKAMTTKKHLRSYAAEFASKGGKARAKALSPEQRSEIAKRGGEAFKQRREAKKRTKGGK
jgi:general stress protein YciG